MYNKELFENLLDLAKLQRIAKLYEVMQKDARKSVRQLFDDNDVRSRLLKAMACTEFKEIVFEDGELEYALYDKLNDHTNTPDHVGEEMFDQVLEEEVNDMKQELLDEIDATFVSLAGEDDRQGKLFKSDEELRRDAINRGINVGYADKERADREGPHDPEHPERPW